MTVSSKEYALALFELGKESANNEELYEAFGFVGEVFASCPELIAFLDSPAIPFSERSAMIRHTLAKEVPAYFLSFLQILCAHRNAHIFEECRNEFEELYTDSVHRTSAHVRSAVALTDQEKDRLCARLEKLSGRKVRVEYEIDASILGGMIVEMDGVCYDGSLKHRLQNIKEVISK